MREGEKNKSTGQDNAAVLLPLAPARTCDHCPTVINELNVFDLLRESSARFMIGAKKESSYCPARCQLVRKRCARLERSVLECAHSSPRDPDHSSGSLPFTTSTAAD
eukprot:SAG11_NODE_2029_length_3902_cov_2.613463_7_plen_107_part_00